MEEFGLSRDGNSYSAKSSVKVRNAYYEYIFRKLYLMAQKNPQVAGVNFWAWAGEGRPRDKKDLWHKGDDFIGDPPHELQGWYSVYDSDSSTKKVIREYAEKFSKLE